jgi:hypothetical protein
LEVFLLIEDFEVGIVYPFRTYERHQFCFSMDGKEYKGDYYDEFINWLNPHPKQVVDEEQLNVIEAEVHKMLGVHGVKEDIENIEIERMMNKHHAPSGAHRFKLRTEGEEFRGVFRDENIDWLHPKPQGKLKHDKIEKLEQKVQKEIIKHEEKKDLGQ